MKTDDYIQKQVKERLGLELSIEQLKVVGEIFGEALGMFLDGPAYGVSESEGE